MFHFYGRVADRRNKTPPGMGWNVYDEAPRAAASSHYIGEDEKEVLAEIFFQHAVSGAFWVFFWGFRRIVNYEGSPRKHGVVFWKRRKL